MVIEHEKPGSGVVWDRFSQLLGNPFANRMPGDAAVIACEALEISFLSAPGAFQVDLQESDTDTDAAYATIGSITCVNSSNYGRYDDQTTGRYRCVNLVSRTNSVPLTVNIDLK
jgi:hypothetical protein